jgi:hypothetical protein
MRAFTFDPVPGQSKHTAGQFPFKHSTPGPGSYQPRPSVFEAAGSKGRRTAPFASAVPLRGAPSVGGNHGVDPRRGMTSGLSRPGTPGPGSYDTSFGTLARYDTRPTSPKRYADRPSSTIRSSHGSSSPRLASPVPRDALHSPGPGAYKAWSPFTAAASRTQQFSSRPATSSLGTGRRSSIRETFSDSRALLACRPPPTPAPGHVDPLSGADVVTLSGGLLSGRRSSASLRPPSPSLSLATLQRSGLDFGQTSRLDLLDSPRSFSVGAW